MKGQSWVQNLTVRIILSESSKSLNNRCYHISDALYIIYEWTYNSYQGNHFVCSYFPNISPCIEQIQPLLWPLRFCTVWTVAILQYQSSNRYSEASLRKGLFIQTDKDNPVLFLTTQQLQKCQDPRIKIWIH